MFYSDKLQPHIYESLLAAALNRYREIGVPTVSVYMTEDRRTTLEDKGLLFIGEEMRWIADCVAGRRYHAFSQMLYGHLLLKRENIHKKRLRNEKAKKNQPE